MCLHAETNGSPLNSSFPEFVTQSEEEEQVVSTCWPHRPSDADRSNPNRMKKGFIRASTNVWRPPGGFGGDLASRAMLTFWTADSKLIEIRQANGSHRL